MNKYIRIGLIEDNRKLLQSYVEFFEMQEDYLLSFAFESIHTFQSGFNPAIHSQPDIILLDIHLPQISGLDGIRVLRERLPASRIIMLTAYDDKTNVISALKNGAAGYLIKGMSLFEMKAMLDNYARVKTPALSSRVTSIMIDHFNGSKSAQSLILEGLTKREKDIVNCLADGATYKECAQQLGITSHTVNEHCKNIYMKLNIGSKAELISIVLRNT